MKGMLVISTEKCLGCRSCELACAVEHSSSRDLIKAILEEPRSQHRVEVEAAGEVTVPLQCRHCEDAPCVTVCPTRALEKSSPDSPVSLKGELCIGCKWCIMVCPFGVVKLSRDGKAVVKCDLCERRREKEKEPACVEACPTGALRFVEVGKVSKRRRGQFLVSLVKGEKKAVRVEKEER